MHIEISSRTILLFVNLSLLVVKSRISLAEGVELIVTIVIFLLLFDYLEISILIHSV